MATMVTGKGCHGCVRSALRYLPVVPAAGSAQRSGMVAATGELQLLGLLRPASRRRGDQAQKRVFPYISDRDRALAAGRQGSDSDALGPTLRASDTVLAKGQQTHHVNGKESMLQAEMCCPHAENLCKTQQLNVDACAG